MWKPLLCTAIIAHASFGVWAASGKADTYPNKPIRVLDGFAAGGGSDYVARVIGPKITESLGQTVIVDNRPGAGANLAAEITARANPDGYTLMLVAVTALATSPNLYPKLGYDLLKDFSYISLVAEGAFVLVAHPSVPARSLPDLLSAAKAKPKSISYGSSGVAGGGHLAMELLQSRAGAEFHHVPYNGAGPAVIALVGGEVQLVLGTTASAMQMIKAKRVHALAVTSPKRVEALPDVPTIAESGFPGYAVTVDYGLVAPTGTPAAVIRMLNAEIQRIARMDDIKAKLAVQGFEPASSTPAEFRALTKAQVELWTRVIKNARITAN